MLTFETLPSIDASTTELAAALIAETWPGYGAIFRREMEIYQGNADFFKPFFALCRDDSAVAGFAILLPSLMSFDLATVSWVAVKKPLQRQGIGKKIVGLCLEEAKRRGRQVILTTSSPDFYKPLNFDAVCRFRSDETAFVMMGRDCP